MLVFVVWAIGLAAAIPDVVVVPAHRTASSSSGLSFTTYSAYNTTVCAVDAVGLCCRPTNKKPQGYLTVVDNPVPHFAVLYPHNSTTDPSCAGYNNVSLVARAQGCAFASNVCYFF
jgi:hypothetical protein